MAQQLSFIWPALGQRPSGLARQRRAGRSAADGACRAPASPELLAWPRGRIKPGAGLILAGSRFALGSADVPPAETPRRPPGPAVNGYRLHVVAGTGQVDHALASWLAGPGQAVPAGVAASATSAGARPTRRTPGCSGDTDNGADFLGKPDLPHTYSPVPDIAVGLATLGTHERAGLAPGPAARAVRRGDGGFVGRACPCPGWLIGMTAPAWDSRP